VGFDIREFREDLYGEEVNDNLNETIVTISTAGTLVLGGFALSAYAAGSAAFNATATAAINVGLINAGIGLTTQLIFNGGDSSELDYGSLALDFGFGTLGSFVGAGVAAKTGGGLVSRIAASTAFEGAFAGGEQVVRNLANGDSWSQDVRSAIVQGALSQLGGEIIENAPVGKLLDKFNFVGGSKGKGGDSFAASTNESISSGGIPDWSNRGVREIGDAVQFGRLQEEDAVSDLLFGARVGEGLPGAGGVRISRRPTANQLELLSTKHNVEFGVVYKLGPGPNGRGGQYFLYSGVVDQVQLPLEADIIFISHTHPGGTRVASQADKDFLKALELLGSPQRTSEIVPVGGKPFKFNKNRSRLNDD